MVFLQILCLKDLDALVFLSCFGSNDLYAWCARTSIKDWMDMEMEIEQLEQMENNDGKINGK